MDHRDDESALAVDLNKPFVSSGLQKDKILRVGEGNGRQNIPVFSPLKSGQKLATHEQLKALETILQLRADSIAERGDEVQNVDLDYTIVEGKVAPDLVKATKTRRGGGSIRRTKASENRLYSIADFVVGEAVQVLYDGDSKWHAATILTKMPNGMCRVNYTGYNEEATVAPSSHMRKVPLMEGWIGETSSEATS